MCFKKLGGFEKVMSTRGVGEDDRGRGIKSPNLGYVLCERSLKMLIGLHKQNILEKFWPGQLFHFDPHFVLYNTALLP